MNWNIKPFDPEILVATQDRSDNLIKPIGSLAFLERIACQAAGAQEKIIPEFVSKAMISITKSKPSAALQVLAKRENAKLIGADPKTETPTELAERLARDGIQAIGIALPEWREEVAATDWQLLKQNAEVLWGSSEERAAELNFTVDFYQAAAAKRILIVLDGPASLLAAVLATRKNPALLEYLISSRSDDKIEHQEMMTELGLAHGLRVHMKGNTGLSSAFGLGLVDAAVRAIREMATFDEASVAYSLADFSTPEKKEEA